MTIHLAFLSSITVQIVIIHASFSYGLWFRNAYRNVRSILGPLLSLTRGRPVAAGSLFRNTVRNAKYQSFSVFPDRSPDTMGLFCKTNCNAKYQSFSAFHSRSPDTTGSLFCNTIRSAKYQILFCSRWQKGVAAI
jgi:hypothetical protein